MKNPFAQLARKNLHTWLGGYAKRKVSRVLSRPRVAGPKHLLFAFCDHYEPLWGDATSDVGDARVKAWQDEYPKMASAFRDADGCAPKHSFFFPGEQYDKRYLDRLAKLCEAGFGEVEVHLHHDGDTAEKLRRDLLGFLDAYGAHGHLCRDADGKKRYAFIHGNWCLANARKDGRWCGVDEEIPLLFETGCYADFTFPSAPDECQPNLVNSIYWPTGNLAAKRAYEHGEPARVGVVRGDRILMIEGPIALAQKPGTRMPRIESAAVTAADPPTPERVASWVDQGICVEGRPEWIFVKVHTHGAPETQARAILGDASRMLHAELVGKYNDGDSWRLHYVSAREMFNIAIAAMRGADGDPGRYRDYLLPAPPIAQKR